METKNTNPQLIVAIARNEHYSERLDNGESIDAIINDVSENVSEMTDRRNAGINATMDAIANCVETGASSETLSSLLEQLDKLRKWTPSDEIASIVFANAPIMIGKPSTKRYGRGSSEHGDSTRRPTGCDKTKCVISKRTKTGRAVEITIININKSSERYNESVSFTSEQWSTKTFGNATYRNQNEFVVALTDAIGLGDYYRELMETNDVSRMGPLRNVQNNIRNAMASNPKKK